MTLTADPMFCCSARKQKARRLDLQVSHAECRPPPAPEAWFMEGARAQLDPAHAQRTIRITSDGDAGLIALAACQA